MKITYAHNPLNTTVELDENEKKELWYKIKVEELTESLGMAELYLSEGSHFNLEDARKEVDSSYYDANNDNEKSELDKRCDTVLEYYISELQSSHVGDCTCVPCSCLKCHAESILGIDTVPGLNKYMGNKIQSVFTKKEGDKYINVTLDEAIEKLSKFEIDPAKYDTEGWKKLGGYEQYLPRWEQEQKQSHDWLVNYKNEHFKDLP